MQPLQLLLGDLLALLAFVLVGRVQHGLSFSPAEILATSFPFAIAWLMAGFAAGLLKWQPQHGAMSLFKKTSLHLIMAIPAGMLIRVLFTGQGISFTFFMVTMAFTALFLYSWRVLYWAFRRRKTEN